MYKQLYCFKMILMNIIMQQISMYKQKMII